MHKTLQTPGREMALRTWAETGLMKVLLPNWLIAGQRIAAACARWPRDRADALDRAALSACWLPQFEADPSGLEGSLIDLKQRLKFSNEELDQLQVALRAQPLLAQARSVPWSRLQPLLIDIHIAAAPSNFACARGLWRSRPGRARFRRCATRLAIIAIESSPADRRTVLCNRLVSNLAQGSRIC